MKKSLLALAVLGAFAGAASAQSSVTIYGLIDMGIAKGNGGGARNDGANGASEAWQVKQANSSRLGFRGNEDLGGGMSAQFHFEHRFHPDDGQLDNAPYFWQARSYVQLTSAAVGSVYLGREYVPAFWPAVKTDPSGWNYVMQAGGAQFAGFAAQCGGSSIRTSNTVGYRSPNLGGLTVQAAVALGEGAPCPRETGFNVEYGAGPIYVGLGYEKLSGSNPANDGNSLFNLGGSYDFGMAKLIGYYARAKVNGGNDTNKDWMIGVSAPLGGGSLRALYNNLDPQGDSNSVKKFGIGYSYFLSKRTSLYADYGRAKSDVNGVKTNSAYDFGVLHTF